MSETDELQECQGCGRADISGFCDECERHGVTSPPTGMAGIFAKATSIEAAANEYTCQCTSCRIHISMKSEDGKPWKCLKPNSVGPNGFFCKNCIVEMSYNSELDKYTYDDETPPEFKEAARVQRSKQSTTKEANVEPFLADVMDVTNKSDDYVVCATLYDRYSRYCQGNGLNAKNNIALGDELSHLDIERKRKTLEGRQFWAYCGLKLKEAAA